MKRMLVLATAVLLTMFVAPVAADEDKAIKVHLSDTTRRRPLSIHRAAPISRPESARMAPPSTIS